MDGAVATRPAHRASLADIAPADRVSLLQADGSPMNSALCLACGEPLLAWRRADARTCGDRCRQRLRRTAQAPGGGSYKPHSGPELLRADKTASRPPVATPRASQP